MNDAPDQIWPDHNTGDNVPASQRRRGLNERVDKYHPFSFTILQQGDTINCHQKVSSNLE